MGVNRDDTSLLTLPKPGRSLEQVPSIGPRFFFPSFPAKSRPVRRPAFCHSFLSARDKRDCTQTPRRRRKRHIPRFRRKAKARSFCCGSSPHERRSAFRGDPGFAPLGFGGGPVLSPKGIPLIRPLRGHLPPGEGRIRTRSSPRYRPSAGRWADAPAPWCPAPGR